MAWAENIRRAANINLPNISLSNNRQIANSSSLVRQIFPDIVIENHDINVDSIRKTQNWVNSQNFSADFAADFQPLNSDENEHERSSETKIIYDNCRDSSQESSLNNVCNSNINDQVLHEIQNIIHDNISTDSDSSISQKRARSDHGNLISPTVLPTDYLNNISESPNHPDVQHIINSLPDSTPVTATQHPNNTATTPENREKFVFGNSCSCKSPACRANEFEESYRRKIFDQFIGLHFNEKRSFISKSYVVIEHKHRQAQNHSIADTETGNNKRCKNSLAYYLPNMNGRPVRVCKLMLLRTLGYSDKSSVIKSTIKANSKANLMGSVSAAPDMRGKREPANKLVELDIEIINFIEMHRPCSHYTVLHAPHRRYLPATLNKTILFKRFIEFKGEAESICSTAHFTSVVRKMNIGFNEPSQDLCTLCERHRMHVKEDHGSVDDPECIICNEGILHKNSAKVARDNMSYETETYEKNPRIMVVAADLQKAVNMPLSDDKDYYFKEKLVLFNETFSETKNGGMTSCICWHEEQAGRLASNIASSYLEFLRHVVSGRQVEHMIIFSDNCSSQNKNRWLFAVLAMAINDPEFLSLQSIELRYLISGHTFMKPDVIHAQIAKKLKHIPRLGSFDDFCAEFEKCHSKLEVVKLNHNHMLDISEKEHLIPLCKYKVKLNDIQIVRFEKGSPNAFIKTSYQSEQFSPIDIISPSFLEQIRIRKNLAPNGSLFTMFRRCKVRGIKLSKKKDLLSMCPLLDRASRLFYENLVSTDDVRDLEIDFDEIEY